MRDKIKTGFNDRLSAAADARKATLAKFKPKPAVMATDLKTRAELKAQERESFRLARQEAKELAAKEKVDQELAVLESKRNERKERKAAEKAGMRARKSARYTTLDALADMQFGNREAS